MEEDAIHHLARVRAESKTDVRQTDRGQRSRQPLLDPANAFDYLIRGRDIDTDSTFLNADTAFLPATNVTATLTAGGRIDPDSADRPVGPETEVALAGIRVPARAIRELPLRLRGHAVTSRQRHGLAPHYWLRAPADVGRAHCSGALGAEARRETACRRLADLAFAPSIE